MVRTTVDLMKKNMATVVSTVTFITLIVGSAFTVESRYAKAADITDLKTYVKQQHAFDRWQNQQSMLLSRKQQIEDQLFMLRLKPNPTLADKAMTQHYIDQLNEVTAQLAAPSPPAPTD